jgi:hypothetical protein
VKLSLSISTLLLGALATLFLVVRSYNAQSAQHTLELQKQREHFESLAEAERAKRFAKPLNISNKHIV